VLHSQDWNCRNCTHCVIGSGREEPSGNVYIKYESFSSVEKRWNIWIFGIILPIYNQTLVNKWNYPAYKKIKNFAKNSIKYIPYIISGSKMKLTRRSDFLHPDQNLRNSCDSTLLQWSATLESLLRQLSIWIFLLSKDCRAEPPRLDK